LNQGINEVVVSYQLDVEGRANDIEVISNWSGEARWSDYVVGAMQGWEFLPELIDGKPVIDRRYMARFCIYSRQHWAKRCSAEPPESERRAIEHVAFPHPVPMPSREPASR
jgi:hypothetical protein